MSRVPATAETVETMLANFKQEADRLAELSRSDFNAAITGMQKLTAGVLPEVRYDEGLKWRRGILQVLTLTMADLWIEETPREKALEKIRGIYYKALDTISDEAVHQSPEAVNAFVKLCRRLGCPTLARWTVRTYQQNAASRASLTHVAAALATPATPLLAQKTLPQLPQPEATPQLTVETEAPKRAPGVRPPPL